MSFFNGNSPSAPNHTREVWYFCKYSYAQLTACARQFASGCFDTSGCSVFMVFFHARVNSALLKPPNRSPSSPSQWQAAVQRSLYPSQKSAVRARALAPAGGGGGGGGGGVLARGGGGGGGGVG